MTRCLHNDGQWLIPDLDWVPGRAPWALAGDEVHVWYTELAWPAQLAERAATILSAHERHRSERFVFERDASRYRVGRAVLRALSGRYLGVHGGQLQIESTAAGKPRFPMDPIHFSVAHSGDAALIAFARESPLGVDLEGMRRLSDSECLVDTFFSPEERETFHRLPPDRRERAFFTCWTRKEAYLKATGTGLSASLSDFSVTFTDAEPPAIRLGSDRGTWSLHHLEPPANAVGALAIPGSGWRLRTWKVDAGALVRAMA